MGKTGVRIPPSPPQKFNGKVDTQKKSLNTNRKRIGVVNNTN